LRGTTLKTEGYKEYRKGRKSENHSGNIKDLKENEE